MRTARNLSLVLLMMVSVFVFGGAGVRADGYCDWYGLVPAAYMDGSNVSCDNTAYPICNALEGGGPDGCRLSCLSLCGVSNDPALVNNSCPVDELGGGQCNWGTAICTCDTDW